MFAANEAAGCTTQLHPGVEGAWLKFRGNLITRNGGSRQHSGEDAAMSRDVREHQARHRIRKRPVCPQLFQISKKAKNTCSDDAKELSYRTEGFPGGKLVHLASVLQSNPAANAKSHDRKRTGPVDDLALLGT